MTQSKGTKRKGPGKSMTSPEAIATTLRHATWLEAKAKGRTYDAIAEEHGVDPSTVYEAIQRRLRETVRVPAEELRNLEVIRLDAQLERLLKAIEESDEGKIHGLAESLFLKQSERRAKLLGLDAPTKLQDVTPPREEIAATVMALLENPTEEFAKMLEKTGWVRK